MRKDGGGGGATSPPPLSLPCLDVKPFVVTLVLLTLFMAAWQLQPYENILESRSPCPIPTTTTISAATNNTTSAAVVVQRQKISSAAASSSSNTTTTTSAAAVVQRQKLSSAAASSSSNTTTTTSAAAVVQRQKLSSAAASSPSNTTTTTATVTITSKVETLKAVPAPSDPNKRVFRPYGSAAALFVHMGAYRGGAATFAVIGLASKPAHVFGKPWYKCEWVPDSPSRATVRAKAYKMLPDWGYGHVYTVVVVNCTFPSNPNADNSGGKLFLYAYYSPNPRRYEKFVALEEAPGAYDASRYTAPFPYDYFYCGSSLYGDLSAARIREWMAYHVHFFGPRSHFVFHDAGGVSPAVRAVLEPWVRAGRATIQDIRAQEAYDGYYYNQFMVVNDCLHRYRHAANWTFYFDVDEYIYLPDGRKLENVLQELSGYTQFTIEQNPMSSKLCVKDPNVDYSREWGFEKLVFRNSITHVRRDRKYAIQARNAYATGVHMSENVIGPTTHKTESMIRYYHYHNSINVLGEPCQEFVPMPAPGNVTWFEKVPYVYDDNMKKLADTIKRFEEQSIGHIQV